MVVTLLISTPGVAHAQARPDDPRAEVIGGTQAGSSEFPWVVRLSNGCAGTLIGSRYVLTAAHCVNRTGRTSSIVITAGSSDLYSSKAFDVRSEAVERASGFRGVTSGNDWAVVRLSKEVDLPVVELPRGDDLDSGAFTVIGWGATRESSLGQQRYLRKVQVSFVSDSTCGQLYREDGYGFVSSDMLCAGDLKRGGKDSCQGDSGGPLLRRSANSWVQVGIVSWGVGCGRAEYPGIYTQISHFMPDIARAVKQTTIEETATPG